MLGIDEDVAVLHAVLRRADKKIATAESVTAGHLQALIGGRAGASDVFCGGITAYSIEEKVKILKVDRPHAETVNCVSDRVVREMARGATTRFKCGVTVATTGYAEISKAGSPHAWMAVKIGEEVSTRCARGEGTRIEVQIGFARDAIRLLVDSLRALVDTESLDATGESLRLAMLCEEPWLEGKTPG
jgi:PncC family amidohydrolase